MTLTTPAVATLEDRFDRKEQRRQVKRARAAWGPFWRSTPWGKQTRTAGDRSKRARRDTSFILAGETSPRGVVHLHVAIYGEFVHQRQLQALWGQALGTFAPVVDVRAIRGGAAGVGSAIREVLKYTFKAEKGPRQAAHAAILELAYRRVRRIEIGGALRRVKITPADTDTDDVQAADLHATHAATCQACGTVGEWEWLAIVGSLTVEMNAGFGLVRDYVPRPEIRPNRIV